MAYLEHIDILNQGVAHWNHWRVTNPKITPDLSGVDLRDLDLSGINFSRTNLDRVNFRALIRSTTPGEIIRTTCLRDADFSEAHFDQTDFYLADLRRAKFTGASVLCSQLMDADLREADFSQANLSATNFMFSDLRKAVFSGAKLRGSLFIRSNIEGATFSNCEVFGICAWDLHGTAAQERDLVIDGSPDPSIIVDNIEFAQFLYILMHNKKLRLLIETLNSRTVLILGSFSKERKPILQGIREIVRGHKLIPIIFDWERPRTQGLNETVMLLAQMASFIIADITDASSVAQELQLIVPHVCKPVIPLILRGHRPYGMFEGLRQYSWLSQIIEYSDLDDLRSSFQQNITKHVV